jgi:catalase
MIKSSIEFSSVLSMSNTIKDSIKTRKIAILAAEGVNEISLNAVKDALVNEGAVVDIIAPRLGKFMSKNDVELEANKSFLNTGICFL